MDFREAIAKYFEEPITRQLLRDTLKTYKRPYDKVSELVKEQVLTPVKRGIYIPGPALNIAKPEPFLLANHLLGPSYVSLDSALSYWGLIPERVFEVSSVTTGPSKTYKTAAGRFSYIHLNLPYYSFGIKRLALTNRQRILIASPEKALCDKIVTTAGILLRSSKQTMALLVEDFRIEKESLRKLDAGAIRKWTKDAPKSNSLTMLLKTLDNL